MGRTWERSSTPRSRSRPEVWRGAIGPAGVLLAVGVVVLPLRVVQAQANPAFVVRQMEARIADLSRMAQRLNEQLIAERQMRTRQQQQMAATSQRLQRLQAAVNSAAAAGDPTAQAVRSASAQTVLEKLAAQFETRAGSARQGKTAASAEQSAPPDLTGARLSGAGLRGAKLPQAHLQEADLRNADLTGAALPGADLRGAKLQGAILTGADLTNADLKDALYDDRTRWPEGYDPQKGGTLRVK
jgi:uncharacterized coiled-coil protein SlyX